MTEGSVVMLCKKLVSYKQKVAYKKKSNHVFRKHYTIQFYNMIVNPRNDNYVKHVTRRWFH